MKPAVVAQCLTSCRSLALQQQTDTYCTRQELRGREYRESFSSQS